MKNNIGLVVLSLDLGKNSKYLIETKNIIMFINLILEKYRKRGIIEDKLFQQEHLNNTYQ